MVAKTDWLLLWDRNNGTQQRWVLEPVISDGALTAQSDTIKVRNLTGVVIEVFISKYSDDGNEGWFDIPVGSWDSWHRKKEQAIVARAKGAAIGAPGTTIGAWVPASSVVTIIGFGQPIDVSTS